MSERFPEQEGNKQELLSGEEKKRVAEAWVDVALEGGSVPENIDVFTDGELKEWLFESLTDEVCHFIETSEIAVDDDLAKKIITTVDVNERSELERNYLQKIQNAIDIFSKTYRERKVVTTWNSCPSLMKETKSFNCVGSTLVAMQFLDKARIASQIGNPTEHIVTVVQLADGSTVYADFLNGPNNLKKVEPVFEEVAGVPTLILDDKGIDYKHVPLFTKEEVVAPVIGNLCGMTSDEDEKSKDGAAAFVDKHSKHYEQVDFGEIEKTLYPKHRAAEESDVMQEEKKEIRAKRALEKPFREYRRSLSEEQISALVSEIEEKKDIIKEFIANNNELLFENFSEELIGYMRVITEIIASTEKPEDMKKMFIEKIN